MEQHIATNTSQSARLIDCGVERSTADMYLEKSNIPPADYNLHTIAEGIDHAHWFKYRGNRDIIPAWSLSALLALLPKEIVDEGGDSYYLTIAQDSPLTDDYGVSYLPAWSDDDALTRTHDNCPIEACVQMIEWLFRNGHKLNNRGNG